MHGPGTGLAKFIYMFDQNFSPKISETVQVEKMLTDLVPGFLKNKFDDINFINSLIEKKEFSHNGI